MNILMRVKVTIKSQYSFVKKYILLGVLGSRVALNNFFANGQLRRD